MKDSKKDFTELSIDDQVLLVDEALRDEVYPALRMDGGGLEIMDIQGTEVFIRYFGACGGCPIGQGGTLNFIEFTLQQKVDPRMKVTVIENY